MSNKYVQFEFFLCASPFNISKYATVIAYTYEKYRTRIVKCD